MTKRLIIAFSVGIIVGAAVAIIIKRTRRSPMLEDLAGETRPIIVTD